MAGLSESILGQVSMGMTGTDTVDAVVIGRDEGARLIACLASLAGQVRRVVYVDSGSGDGSVVAARSQGATVVVLDPERPFTAARARNAGLSELAKDPPDYVMFLDGDTQLRDGFLTDALATFANRPKAVVVCGRRREVAPQASVYNRMIDREWDGLPGKVLACGGDALILYPALAKVGGYDPGLIAGEEPDLCLRLRFDGGEIWRIATEMTWHDAALTHWSQWHRRSIRAGHAFAEGWARHGYAHWGRETLRAFLWGALLPLAILLGGLVQPSLFLAALIYLVQWLRLARAGGRDWATLTLLSKFSEALGVLDYAVNCLLRRKRGLIEYK